MATVFQEYQKLPKVLVGLVDQYYSSPAYAWYHRIKTLRNLHRLAPEEFSGYLNTFLEDGHLETIDNLIQARANCNLESFLSNAAGQGYLALVTYIVNQHQTVPGAKGKRKRQTWHRQVREAHFAAIRCGQVKVLSYLMGIGGPYSFDDFGRFCTEAIDHNQSAVVDFFIQEHRVVASTVWHQARRRNNTFMMNHLKEKYDFIPLYY